jgi:acyl-phosphate glycerol 3-phosphate acyltransferase
MTEAIRALAPVLLGYLLGSIPFGYLIVRAYRGIDIREYGSHNIGATNVLRVVGWFPALLTLLADVGKGVAPPLLAALPPLGGSPPNGWVVVLAALAAVVGHAYSGFFYLRERRFARGKAVATGLGAVIGFVAAGQASPVVLAVIALLWAGAVLLPRPITGRYGWVSLGSILAAGALPVALWLTGAAVPYIAFGVAAALFVAWKHKENIGRLLDGVEPRLGERLPLAGVDRDEVACAFLIHPLTPEDWWQTRRFSWAVGLYRAGILPLGVLRCLMKRVRPGKMDTLHGVRVRDGRRVQVHLLCVPWLPDMIKANPELATVRAIQAAEMARGLGARCLGLGAYWSVVGNKGLDVQKAAHLPITNGGAYTAGTVKQAVPQVFAKLRARGIDPSTTTAVVVGANGVVGFGICRQLCGLVHRLVMVGTDRARLERSAALLRRRATAEIVTSTALDDCRNAAIIFTATSNVEPVLFPEHVAEGTILLDLGRPADVHPDVARLPGVAVIPGGVVRPPGELRQRLDVHFPPGCIPACMAETLLMALDECYERASLGEGTLAENIDYFVERAVYHGFEVINDAVEPAPEMRGLPAAPRLRPAPLPLASQRPLQ